MSFIHSIVKFILSVGGRKQHELSSGAPGPHCHSTGDPAMWKLSLAGHSGRRAPGLPLVLGDSWLGGGSLNQEHCPP
jgi:hypothetical protein